jgi:hypothetical protein
MTVRIDMNKISDKLQQKFDQIISILAMTHTTSAAASPPRKVYRATNKPPVKHSSRLGGVVAQLKLPTMSASPSRDSTASTWANDFDSDYQDIYHSVSILMQVDPSQVEENPCYRYAIWVGMLQPSSIFS